MFAATTASRRAAPRGDKAAIVSRLIAGKDEASDTSLGMLISAMEVNRSRVLQTVNRNSFARQGRETPPTPSLPCSERGAF